MKLHASMYQQAGLPDIVAVLQGLTLWLEVKRPGERHAVSAIQSVVHAKLRAAGAEVYVVESLDEVKELSTRAPARDQRKEHPIE